MVKASVIGDLPPGLRLALETYKARLRDRFGDRVEVRLFGSWARRDARADSDIDVFVAVRDASFADEHDAAGIAGDVAVETGVWLSPVVYSADRWRYLLSIENPFAEAVERESVTV